MERKEHVAWLVPIAITMAAVVVAQYGSDPRNHPNVWQPGTPPKLEQRVLEGNAKLSV